MGWLSCHVRNAAQRNKAAQYNNESESKRAAGTSTLTPCIVPFYYDCCVVTAGTDRYAQCLISILPRVTVSRIMPQARNIVPTSTSAEHSSAVGSLGTSPVCKYVTRSGDARMSAATIHSPNPTVKKSSGFSALKSLRIVSRILLPSR